MTPREDFTKDLKTLIAIAEAILVGFSKENDKEMLTEFFKSLISKWETEDDT